MSSERRFSLLPRGDGGVVPEWAITYADLITLVLIFFIALFSYSEMSVDRYRALAAGMRQAFGVGSQPGQGRTTAKQGEDPDANAAAGMRAERELDGLAASGGPGGPFEISRSAEGLRLRVSERLMFGVGSAELAPEAGAFLDRLAPILARYPYRVEVQGHTDSTPIRTTVFPSNWELSAARAGTVVRELIARGVPASGLRAVGLADTNPLVPEDDPAGRGRNRRVEFLLTRGADRGASPAAAARDAATEAAPGEPASTEPQP